MTNRSSSFVFTAVLLFAKCFEGMATSCLPDLDAVATAMLVTDPEETTTLILCPDTVYQVGDFGPDGTIINGGPPIALRENFHLKCGDSGESANNCLVTGGRFQLLLWSMVAIQSYI